MLMVSELFDVQYGHSLELNRLTQTSQNKGIAFVSRKMGDNGISAYVAPVSGIEPSPAGILTSALGGNGVLSTFLQETPFYSGRDVAHLTPLKELTKQQMLYYCVCIKSNRFRYSYGRQANRTLKEILIPELHEIPGWVSEVNPDMYAGTNSPAMNTPPTTLDTSSWLPFILKTLFDIQKGKRLTKANMARGVTPYIGSTDSNNGITAYVGQVAIHEANTISLSYDGSVGEAFYQPAPFWASDAVNVFYPKFEMTPEIALFFCTVIRQEKYRFNYGRKWHLERMRECVIRLPVRKDRKPDFDFMKRYIKSLPYSSQI